MVEALFKKTEIFFVFFLAKKTPNYHKKPQKGLRGVLFYFLRLVLTNNLDLFTSSLGKY